MSKVKFYYFNLVDQDATDITASSEDPFFPASNLKVIHSTKTFRTPSGTNSGNVVFDFKTREDVDSILIRGNVLDGQGFSGSVTIEANATDEWSSPPFSTTLSIEPLHNLGIKTLTTSQKYRFWRVSGTGADYFELSNIFIGQYFQPGRNISFNWSMDERDLTRIVENSYGQPFGDEQPNQKRFRGRLRWLNKAENDAWDKVVSYIGTRRNFWFVQDEDEDYYTEKERLAGVFRFARRPVPTNPNYQLFNYQLNMIGVN